MNTFGRIDFVSFQKISQFSKSSSGILQQYKLRVKMSKPVNTDFDHVTLTDAVMFNSQGAYNLKVNILFVFFQVSEL
jgi:hypothetical protein